MVCPSGADLAIASVLALFSTTKGWPRTCERRSAGSRARTSVEQRGTAVPFGVPPGAGGLVGFEPGFAVFRLPTMRRSCDLHPEFDVGEARQPAPKDDDAGRRIA